MIGEAIRTLLAGVTSNVSPSFVAQTKEMPWVVYQEVSRDPLNLKDGGGSFDTVSMSVDIHHTTATLCDTMARNVRDALDYYSGTTDDVVIESCYFDNEQDLYEPDAEIYRRVQDYTFIVKDVSGYFGLLDFDNNCYIAYNGLVDNDGLKDMKITWKMYLDYYSVANQGILNFNDGVVNNRSIMIEFEATGGDKVFTLAPAFGSAAFKANVYTLDSLGGGAYLDQVIECEAIFGDKAIVSMKVNGVALTLRGTTTFGSGSAAAQIGRGLQNNARLMKGGTMWDFKFYNKDTLVQLHEFPGLPSGNTDGAWDDTVGNLEATFTTVSGTPGTRDIIT